MVLDAGGWHTAAAWKVFRSTQSYATIVVVDKGLMDVAGNRNRETETVIAC